MDLRADEFSFVLSGSMEYCVKDVRLMQVREDAERRQMSRIGGGLKKTICPVYGFNLSTLASLCFSFVPWLNILACQSSSAISSGGCLYTTILPGQLEKELGFSSSKSP